LSLKSVEVSVGKSCQLTNSTKTKQKKMSGSRSASHAAPDAREPPNMASAWNRSWCGSNAPDVQSVENHKSTTQAKANLLAWITATPPAKSGACCATAATSSWVLQRTTHTFSQPA